jgi:predicted nucleotidyltransferase
VILFGSHARGDAGPGSDLDFLVVEPSVDDPAGESVRLRRTLRGLGLFADVVVISEREAEEWREVRRGIEFPYTHGLDGLLELCRTNGVNVPHELDGVNRLAPYGVHMSYGTSRGAPLDRDQALAWAAASIEWAKRIIGLPTD